MDFSDSNKQILLEIMSGHGNSEEYRDIASANFLQTGEMNCPEPTEDFLPCCWQAGEMQKKRCRPAPVQRKHSFGKRRHYQALKSHTL